MKTFLALCSLSVLGYAGWFYSHRSQLQADAPQPEQLQVASATPAQTPATTAQTPVPSAAIEPARHLAPAGTMFLLAYRSVRTPHGFTGFALGTPVSVVQEKGAALLVRCEGAQFEVPKEEVTNDVDLANRLAGSDAAEQRALLASAQTANDASDTERLKQMQAEADSIQRTAATASQKASQGAARATKHMTYTNSEAGHFAEVGFGESVAAAKSDALRKIKSSIGEKPFTIISESYQDRVNGHPYRITYDVQ